jgi:hypothetical protein
MRATRKRRAPTSTKTATREDPFSAGGIFSSSVISNDPWEEVALALRENEGYYGAALKLLDKKDCQEVEKQEQRLDRQMPILWASCLDADPGTENYALPAHSLIFRRFGLGAEQHVVDARPQVQHSFEAYKEAELAFHRLFISKLKKVAKTNEAQFKLLASKTCPKLNFFTDTNKVVGEKPTVCDILLKQLEVMYGAPLMSNDPSSSWSSGELFPYYQRAQQYRLKLIDSVNHATLEPLLFACRTRANILTRAKEYLSSSLEKTSRQIIPNIKHEVSKLASLTDSEIEEIRTRNRARVNLLFLRRYSLSVLHPIQKFLLNSSIGL